MGCTAALWTQLDLDSVDLLTPVLTESSLDAEVDRLLDLLPARFALGGLSLGAVVAMALVRRAPERVTRLMLMSANPYAPTKAQRAAWTEQRRALASGVTPRELQRRLLPVLLSPRVVAHRPDLVELTLAMADELGVQLYDAQLRLQATRIDESPALARVRVPTLVVAARQDRLCGLVRHTEMAALILGAQLVVIDDAAHLAPLERPTPIRKALRQWLTHPEPARPVLTAPARGVDSGQPVD